MEINRNEVEERVRALLAEALRTDARKLHSHIRLVEDLEASSMDIVTIAVTLDDAFHVEVDLANLPSHGVTVGDVTEYVVAQLAGR